MYVCTYQCREGLLLSIFGIKLTGFGCFDWLHLLNRKPCSRFTVERSHFYRGEGWGV